MRAPLALALASLSACCFTAASEVGDAGPGITTGTQAGCGSSSGGSTAGKHPLAFQSDALYQLDPAGGKPFALTVGDFNGDCQLDLAVANNGNGEVSFLWGHGDGTFTAAATGVSIGGAPLWIATADLNGDGLPDLAVANAGANTVQVLLARAKGSWNAAVSYPVLSVPNGLALGDFNGDGVLDLAATDYGATTLSILFGNGGGTFQAATSLAAGAQPISAALLPGNVIVAAVQGTGSIETFADHGGTWTTSAPYPAGSEPTSVAVADLNHDGVADLAVTDYGGGVDVLLGAAAGGFGPAANYPAESTPNSVAIADFDGDGNPDLAVANSNNFQSGPGYVSVLLGHGDGTFAPEVTFTVGEAPVAVVSADFNGDGCPDLAIANSVPTLGGVSILLCVP